MDVVNRIDWRRGTPIGAQIFIEADKFHIFTNEIAQHLALPMAFGLVPNCEFVLESHICQDRLSVDKVAMVFIDKAGRIIQLDQGGEVSLRGLPQGVYYLAVRLDEEKHKETNGVPYLERLYKYQVMNLLEPDEGGLFPIMKIQYDQGGWGLCDFIPPCCCICSHPKLVAQAKQCQQMLREMLSLAEKKEMHDVESQVGLLYIELNNSFAVETAVSFIARLKKIIFSLKNNHLFDDKDFEFKQRLNSFIWNEYTPNMLYEMIQDFLYFVTTTVSHLKVEPQKPAPIRGNKVPEDEEVTYTL